MLAIDVLLILLSMAWIIASCEGFTNGIEWLGEKLELSQGAVGSILAAIGTALPEFLVPLVAILGGSRASVDIGQGAIIGAPFMLSTLAMAVTGTAVVWGTRRGYRSELLSADPLVMRRDLRFFLVAYAVAVGVGFVRLAPVRWTVGAGLVVAYGCYVYRTLRQPGALGEDPGPLYFARRHASPPFWLVVIQVLLTLGGILVGAQFFVSQMTALATGLHASPLLLSLVVSPLATELPEKFNSVIWIRVRKDTLALGNITGAMVFQSCMPTAVGLFLTSWRLEPRSLAAAATALISSLILYGYTARRERGTVSGLVLLLGIVPYVAFLALAFSMGS